MPVRYIGRTISHHGKQFFEIAGRLKNYGVGRIIYRHTFMTRYEEPSYYIITRVKPDPENPVVTIDL